MHHINCLATFYRYDYILMSFNLFVKTYVNLAPSYIRDHKNSTRTQLFF